MYNNCVQGTSSLVAFEMVVLKMGIKSATTHSQLPSCTKMTLVHQDGNKSVCSRSATEWGQVGNYVQSICDYVAINCDKSVTVIRLWPLASSAYTEIHISYLHSESSQGLMDVKQQFKISSRNSDGGATRWWFNCNMTSTDSDWLQHVQQSVCIYKLDEICRKVFAIRPWLFGDRLPPSSAPTCALFLFARRLLPYFYSSGTKPVAIPCQQTGLLGIFSCNTMIDHSWWHFTHQPTQTLLSQVQYILGHNTVKSPCV